MSVGAFSNRQAFLSDINAKTYDHFEALGVHPPEIGSPLHSMMWAWEFVLEFTNERTRMERAVLQVHSLTPLAGCRFEDPS